MNRNLEGDVNPTFYLNIKTNAHLSLQVSSSWHQTQSLYHSSYHHRRIWPTETQQIRCCLLM